MPTSQGSAMSLTRFSTGSCRMARMKGPSRIFPGADLLPRIPREQLGFYADMRRRFGDAVPLRLGPYRSWLLFHTDQIEGVLAAKAGSFIRFERMMKVLEGRPNIVDAITNGQVQMVLNTTRSSKAVSDSRSLRRAALMNKVPYFTTVAGAVAASEAIETLDAGEMTVKPLQDNFAA